jgi:hypothetical protein
MSVSIDEHREAMAARTLRLSELQCANAAAARNVETQCQQDMEPNLPATETQH